MILRSLFNISTKYPDTSSSSLWISSCFVVIPPVKQKFLLVKIRIIHTPFFRARYIFRANDNFFLKNFVPQHLLPLVVCFLSLTTTLRALWPALCFYLLLGFAQCTFTWVASSLDDVLDCSSFTPFGVEGITLILVSANYSFLSIS